MGLKRTLDATTEPITVGQLKTHAKIEVGTEDEDELPLLIAAARKDAENYINAAFIEQTWQWSLDGFPSAEEQISRWRMLVPRPPLLSVTFVKYVDLTGATVTLASTHYKVDTISQQGRIEPVYADFWPYARPEMNAVIVEFVAGYGADATAVPENIKLAILLAAADYWRNRENYERRTLPDAAKHLLDLEWAGNEL